MQTSSWSGLAAIGLIQAVSGCVATSVVETSDRSAIQAAIEAGDRVSLVTTGDQRYELTVASLSDLEIFAATTDDTVVVIPYDELTSLEVLEPKPVLTALGLTGAFALSAAIAIEYPAYFLASVLLFWE